MCWTTVKQRQNGNWNRGTRTWRWRVGVRGPPPELLPSAPANQRRGSVSSLTVHPKWLEGSFTGVLSRAQLLFSLELKEWPPRWLQNVINELSKLGEGRNEKGWDINSRPLTSPTLCIYLFVVCPVGKGRERARNPYFFVKMPQTSEEGGSEETRGKGKIWAWLIKVLSSWWAGLDHGWDWFLIPETSRPC